MSAPINNGGPAFPHAQRLWDNDAQSWAVHSVGGMTLRDWFAGQALHTAAIILIEAAKLGVRNSAAENCFETATAEMAQRLADAMLAARTKGQS
jgi:hypothetical protein